MTRKQRLYLHALRLERLSREFEDLHRSLRRLAPRDGIAERRRTPRLEAHGRETVSGQGRT